MGAEWRWIWFQHMLCTGSVSAFYYVALISIIGIIMLNLFMAIILGNFDKSRIVSEKKNVLYAFDEIMNSTHVVLQFDQICDVILGCCSDHVKYNVLNMRRPVTKNTTLARAFSINNPMKKKKDAKGREI